MSYSACSWAAAPASATLGARRMWLAGMWIKAAVANFRVFLMDQRGTGLSSAVTAATLQKQGSPQQQADYLAFFRRARRSLASRAPHPAAAAVAFLFQTPCLGPLVVPFVFAGPRICLSSCVPLSSPGSPGRSPCHRDLVGLTGNGNGVCWSRVCGRQQRPKVAGHQGDTGGLHNKIRGRWAVDPKAPCAPKRAGHVLLQAGQHRARRRAGATGGGASRLVRRPLVTARPELRRLLRPHVPIAGAQQCAAPHAAHASAPLCAFGACECARACVLFPGGGGVLQQRFTWDVSPYRPRGCARACVCAGLVEVLLTGGLPPGLSMPCSAERVYRCTFERVRQQNQKFYRRFPQDVAQVGRAVCLSEHTSRSVHGGAPQKTQVLSVGLSACMRLSASAIRAVLCTCARMQPNQLSPKLRTRICGHGGFVPGLHSDAAACWCLACRCRAGACHREAPGPAAGGRRAPGLWDAAHSEVSAWRPLSSESMHALASQDAVLRVCFLKRT
jgi:hypothetical protein